MKILFLGNLFEKSAEAELFRKSRINRISNAGNILQWNLIEGFEKNLGTPVDILNSLPLGTYPKYYDDILFKSRKWSHSHGADDFDIGSFNLPVMKEVQRVLKYKKKVKEWCRKNQDKERHIVIFTAYAPFFPALINLDKEVKVTLIIADVPLLGTSKEPFFHRLVYKQLVEPNLNRVDNFVLLTEQMTFPLKVGSRPYVVMEGIADCDSCPDNIKEESTDKDKKIIFYSGALQEQYGIGNLLNAFENIKSPDYELWLCGWGSSEADIISRSHRDPRIKFFGSKSNSAVRVMQKQATLLINPRTDEGEFTKYSFPSKTLEYMLSGTPVLMYKLSGTPDEYNEYLHYFDDDNPKNMAERIIKVCEKPFLERNEFGNKAKNFVIQNKNKTAQTAKIIEMLKNN